MRVIGLRDASGKALARGEAGDTVGVVCNQIDLDSLSHAFAGEGDNRIVIGSRIRFGARRTAPLKHRSVGRRISAARNEVVASRYERLHC